MKITTTYEDLREFVSFYHLFQYGNSAVFDRVAVLAQSGIDTEELARLLWVASDCDRVDGLALIYDKVCAWFDSDSPANISRANHPELVKRIFHIADFRRDCFEDPVSEHNIVLCDSFEVDGRLVDVNCTIEGKGYHLDFKNGSITRNPAYDDEEVGHVA